MLTFYYRIARAYILLPYCTCLHFITVLHVLTFYYRIARAYILLPYCTCLHFITVLHVLTFYRVKDNISYMLSSLQHIYKEGNQIQLPSVMSHYIDGLVNIFRQIECYITLDTSRIFNVVLLQHTQVIIMG